MHDLQLKGHVQYLGTVQYKLRHSQIYVVFNPVLKPTPISMQRLRACSYFASSAGANRDYLHMFSIGAAILESVKEAQEIVKHDSNVNLDEMF